MPQEPVSHSPMKVLLWSPGGSGLHYGGPGMTAYRLYSKALAGRFEIILAHGNADQASYPLFHRQHLIAPLDKLGIRQQWSFVHRGQQWINDHYREFDVFHGLQGFHLTVAPALQAKRHGLPAVVKLAAHKSDLADKTGWKAFLGLPARRRRMLMQIDAVIAISQAIVEELRSYGFPEEKIIHIPNGVDTDLFRPADPADRPRLRAELGWPDYPTLLFVGHITPRKRPLLLVEALGLLKQRGVDCQLVLAGPEHDPAYAQQMRHRINELNLNDQVIWIAFTKDVAPLYRAADIFALPSQSEGMPNALLEAMASGLPAVATPISGVTDLITDGQTGRLSPGVAEQIAEALQDYLQNPRQAAAYGQSARRTIEQQFSAAAVLGRHEGLFRKIMAHH